jgi:tetratricopeptide (TPR) repeat protein
MQLRMTANRTTHEFRRRRSLFTFALLCCCITVAMAAPRRALASQAIYLKNGNIIIADSAQADAYGVTYYRAGNEFTIPRKLVDHIGPAKAEDRTAADIQPAEPKRSLPLPAVEVPSDPGPASPVVENGEVNDDYLDRLNDAFNAHPTAGNRHSLSEAYQQAAIFLLRQGHAQAAIEKYREALDLIPADRTLETGLGYLLVKQNHPWQAVEVLLPAADQHPKSPDIFLLLGSAYYALEDLNQAIVEWQKALTLHDSAQLRQAVAQAERERQLSGSYEMLHSQHFVLLFDEGTASDLANLMIPALEDDFQALERDLNYFPQDTIHVILYPKQAFRDITRSPTWVGAVNDGKIRIPVSGLSTITPDLARVMKHELTHSFVHQETLDRCPTWFNEGLAQMEDGSTLVRVGKQLAVAMAAGQTPPFSSLQGSFLNLSQRQAVLAYAESLAAVEYFRDTYGMAGIQRMLGLMRSQRDFSVLLQGEFNMTYSILLRNVTDYLERRYGGQ